MDYLQAYLHCTDCTDPFFCVVYGTNTSLGLCGKQLYDWAFICRTNFINELHINSIEGPGTHLKLSSSMNLFAFNHAYFILSK